jgi:hypothetical protein
MKRIKDEAENFRTLVASANHLENELQRRMCAFLVHQAARLAHDLLPNVPNPKAKQTLRDLTTGLEGIESVLRALELQ